MRGAVWQWVERLIAVDIGRVLRMAVSTKGLDNAPRPFPYFTVQC